MQGMEPQDAVRGFEPKVKGRSSRTFLASTTALRVLLLDFAEDPTHLVQFQRVLGQSQEMVFDVETDHPPAGVTRTWIQRKVERTQPVLTALLFEEAPTCSFLDSLLGPFGEAVGGRLLTVMAPRSSRQNHREILRHGVAELLRAPQLWEPVDLVDRLVSLVDKASDEETRSDPGPAHTNLRELASLSQIIGNSPSLLKVLGRIPALARSQANVLIRGETGTGKELCAEAIHALDPRRNGRFVPLNCARLSETLFEEELFGHVAGAFTSANWHAEGLVRAAEGGTLFLDEVHELVPLAQAKLLRFIEKKQYSRVGSPEVRQGHLRIVAATNANLEARIQSGEFRQDLYYRLRAMELILPPLRERSGDLRLLTEHFLRKYGNELERPPQRLNGEGWRKLHEWPWRGNVRELENVIRLAVTESDQRVIRADQLTLLDSGVPSYADMTFKTFRAKLAAEFKTVHTRSLLYCRRRA